MRHTLLIATALVGLAAVPAFAQPAPPTSEYRGGVGSPLSTQATNIGSSRTEMGSRLPDPNAGAETPEALLAAAQRALNQGKTGAAQEALERAETRVLSRTTEPGRASMPDEQAMVRHIGAARMALGRRDVAGAKAAIQAAMAAPVPPRGPTLTMVPGQPMPVQQPMLDQYGRPLPPPMPQAPAMDPYGRPMPPAPMMDGMGRPVRPMGY